MSSILESLEASYQCLQSPEQNSTLEFLRLSVAGYIESMQLVAQKVLNEDSSI